MPPVAGGESPSLGDVLTDLMERGVNGITSVRQLAKRLAPMKTTTQEGERRSIRRHMGGENADEKSIEWYAKAFNVERSVFPAATRRSRRGVSVADFESLRSRVEDLERQVRETRPRLEGLEPPEATTP